MSEIILDGTGDNYTAKVDIENRLHVRSVSATEVLKEAIGGNTYVVATGKVDITNDTSNFLLYIKNNSDMDMVIERVIVVTGASTDGASNECLFKGMLNPTDGTILTATQFEPFNTNLGSGNSFTGDARTAASTLSLTALNGQAADGFVHGAGRHIFDTTFLLPKGKSIAGGIQAAVGNTALCASISYVVYFRNKDIL